MYGGNIIPTAQENVHLQNSKADSLNIAFLPQQFTQMFCL